MHLTPYILQARYDEIICITCPLQRGEFCPHFKGSIRLGFLWILPKIFHTGIHILYVQNINRKNNYRYVNLYACQGRTWATDKFLCTKNKYFYHIIFQASGSLSRKVNICVMHMYAPIH